MSEAAERSRASGPVDRAFALLQLVVASEEPIGVRELARRSALSPSTTSRTVGILADLGMVERTPVGAVRPGPGLATLTQDLERTPAVVRGQFRPLAGELAERFDENAAIAVDDGTGVLYLASARRDTAVQVPDPAGSSFPYHLTAPGIVAMSAWEDDRLEAHLSAPLAAATAHSITDPADIRRRITRCHRDGWVWTDQELDLEVNGLAVPIADDDGAVVAIATLYGPSYRLSLDLRPSLGAELAEFVAART